MTASTPYNADSNRPNTSLLIKYATSQSQAFPAGNCSSPLDLQPLAARNLSRAQPATRAPGATIGPWMGQHEADWITRPRRRADGPAPASPPPSFHTPSRYSNNPQVIPLGQTPQLTASRGGPGLSQWGRSWHTPLSQGLDRAKASPIFRWLPGVSLTTRSLPAPPRSPGQRRSHPITDRPAAFRPGRRNRWYTRELPRRRL